MQATTENWLQLQCQMITQVNHGLLLQRPTDASTVCKLVATWPADSAPPAGMAAVGNTVFKKQSRTLAHTKSGRIILSQPIGFNDKPWGAIVLELSQRSEQDIQVVQQLLEWGCKWLQLLLYTDQSNDQQELVRLLNYVLHQPSLEHGAIALVNELACRYGCEPVSLGLTQKYGIQLLALSHKVSFDRRTVNSQLIKQAMEEAFDQRHNIHSPANTAPPHDQNPDLILKAHEQLQRENKVHAVRTLLLRIGDQIIGALTLQEHVDRPLSQHDLQFFDKLTRILASVVDTKRKASVGFWAHNRAAVRRLLKRCFGPHYAKGKFLGSIVLVFTGVMLLPSDYWITANATLESTLKRRVLAPQDGYLSSTHARPGESVTAGQALAQLDDRELHLERQKWTGLWRQYSQEYDNAIATHDLVKASILTTQVEQAAVQLKLLDQQLKRTQLVAPIDGVIVSEDLSKSLGAPVKKGQVLFEVTPLKSYRIQLLVDEREIGSLRIAQDGSLVLSSLPGERFGFRVTSIIPMAEIHGGNNYFRVEAKLKEGKSLSPLLRPGMTGSGKILAGRRRLGWIWFHDIFDWLRLALWL